MRKLALSANKLVNTALDPEKLVDVTLVKIPVEAVVFPIGVLLIDPPVIAAYNWSITPLVTYKYVEVVYVPVAFNHTKSVVFNVPDVIKLVTDKLVIAALVANKLLEVVFCAVKLVILAVGATNDPSKDKLVPVALINKTSVRSAKPATVKFPLFTKFPVDVPPPN